MTFQALTANFASLVNTQFGSAKDDYSEYYDDPVGFCLNVLGDKYLTEDTQELLMSVVDNSVTLGKSGNATGKSFSAARAAIWFFLVRKGPVYITAAAPIDNLMIIFTEIFTITAKLPEIFEFMSQTQKQIKSSPGVFIKGLSIPSTGTKEQRIAKFSGKHHKNGVFFINDEASATPDEVFKGEETCASDDKSRSLSIFNPHIKSGWTYRTERDKQANVVHLSAFNHINVISGDDSLAPGAVTRNTTVLRINDLCRPLLEGELAGAGTFELPDFLEGATCIDQKGMVLPPLVPGFYKIVEPQFSTIVLGEYPAAGTNSLINQEWIDAARTRYDQWVMAHGENPPEFVRGTVGVDVAEMGNDSSCMCFKYGGFVAPFISWEKCEIPVTESRIKSHCEGKDISRINVDGTGLGSGVAPHLQLANYPAVKVMVASSPTRDCEFGNFALLNDELSWAVREWLAGDTAMLPPDEHLLEELAAYTYRVSDDGKVRVSPKSVIKDLLRRSPDKFDSLKLNFYNDGKFADRDLS